MEGIQLREQGIKIDLTKDGGELKTKHEVMEEIVDAVECKKKISEYIQKKLEEEGRMINVKKERERICDNLIQSIKHDLNRGSWEVKKHGVLIGKKHGVLVMEIIRSRKHFYVKKRIFDRLSQYS